MVVARLYVRGSSARWVMAVLYSVHVFRAVVVTVTVAWQYCSAGSARCVAVLQWWQSSTVTIFLGCIGASDRCVTVL